MADNPWFLWPPAKAFLRDLYWGGWTKQSIASVYHKDLKEVDRLLRECGLIPRPPERQKTESRIPRNNHAGDGYWMYCERCRHKHCLAPVKPEGCSFGYVKKANQFNEHLLNLRDGHKCYACGHVPNIRGVEIYSTAQSTRGWKDNHLEMQHILPVSRGGTNCLHNLIWLCAPCHRKLAKNRVYGGIPDISRP